MKEKIQIRNIFGRIIFEYACDKNTIKKTVEKAVRSGVDLRNAYLTAMNFRDAKFKNGLFSGANFSYSTLENADLSGTDLSDACFYKASLTGANFSNSKLKGIDFAEATFAPGFEIRKKEIENAPRNR